MCLDSTPWTILPHPVTVRTIMETTIQMVDLPSDYNLNFTYSFNWDYGSSNCCMIYVGTTHFRRYISKSHRWNFCCYLKWQFIYFGVEIVLCPFERGYLLTSIYFFSFDDLLIVVFCIGYAQKVICISKMVGLNINSGKGP